MTDDLSRYDETIAQMTDVERYQALRQLSFDERHPCPVADCRLSAEEHHRLSFGLLSELKSLRQRVRDLENGAKNDD